MKQLHVIVALALLICIEAPAVHAESNIGECDCDITGYLVDPDESGTNVRESPGGKIIKKLPILTDPEFEAGVYIRGFKE